MDLCASNKVDEVRLALEGGASPHVPSPEDKAYGPDSTPLMVSVQNNAHVEVVRLLLAAGADPNRENLSGHAPLDKVQEVETLNALQAAGAWLVGRNAHGLLRARGLGAETAFSETRFFLANDPTFLPSYGGTAQPLSSSLSAGKFTTVQQRLFAFVVQNIALEISATADSALNPGHSGQFVFLSDDGTGPVEALPYYLEAASGAFVVGRSGKDGKSIRFYTKGEESLHLQEGETAVQAAAMALQSAKENSGLSGTQVQTFHGERICFIDLKSQLPAVSYPYFILAAKGVGIAGKTGELGCSAEFFVPGPSPPFLVFSGDDAVQMNTLGGDISSFALP